MGLLANGKFCSIQNFIFGFENASVLHDSRTANFFPCNSLWFLQVYAMVKGEYFQQHKVFSINISAPRDLNKKHLFVFPVLAFLQKAIFLNLASLSGKERKQFGRKMFVC